MSVCLFVCTAEAERPPASLSASVCSVISGFDSVFTRSHWQFVATLRAAVPEAEGAMGGGVGVGGERVGGGVCVCGGEGYLWSDSLPFRD